MAYVLKNICLAAGSSMIVCRCYGQAGCIGSSVSIWGSTTDDHTIVISSRLLEQMSPASLKWLVNALKSLWLNTQNGEDLPLEIREG